MSGQRQTVFYGYDEETVCEAFDDDLKAEWAYIGEGYNGDYNPSDPDDEELLRFYMYQWDDDRWEEVEDSSCCTTIPLMADQAIIEHSLEAIFDRFADALDDPYASVKRLAEELSWISPDEF